MTPFDRDGPAADALLTDLYLDALLAGAVLDVARSGRPGNVAAGLDPAARRAADRLRRDLVRVHPSFRFEERLATRLAEAAMAMRVPAAVGGDARVLPFRSASGTGGDAALLPDPAGSPTAVSGDDLGGMAPDTSSGVAASDVARRAPARPLLIGGALTSAALSLAGAAFVAWRLGRPGRGSTPMARAARAVRDARLAALGESLAGGAQAGDSVRSVLVDPRRIRSLPRRLD